MSSKILHPGVRYTFKVSFEVPEQVYLSEVKDFAVDWLEGGGGCRHPDDPLFDSLQDVKVSLMPNKAKG